MRKTESKTTLTYNVRLVASEEVTNYWLCLLGEAAKAYDACAKFVRKNDVTLNTVAIHHACYDWMRQQYSVLSSQMVIRICRDVCGALRSVKSNGKDKKAKTSEKQNLSMRLDKRLYARFSKDGIDMTGSTKGKRDHLTFSLYPKLLELFENYTPCDPLVFVRKSQLWLSIPFEIPIVKREGEDAVGIDLGMRRLFVTSDGMAFRDKKYLRKRRQVRYMKRCLQSKGTKSAKRRLKKKARKENHMCKDMCYRAIKTLLNSTDAPVLVMEDLKQIKQKTSRRKKKDGSEGVKRKKHNNAFQQVPIRMFRDLLTYKAQLAGRRVETVKPAYTSLTDSRTGRCDGIRKGCRYYCTDCRVLDADWNAAVNIALRSNRPVSNPLPVDGGIRLLSGRPSVNRAERGTTPNVGSLVHSHNGDLQAAQSLTER